jgi:hypothetical protein
MTTCHVIELCRMSLSSKRTQLVMQMCGITVASVAQRFPSRYSGVLQAHEICTALHAFKLFWFSKRLDLGVKFTAIMFGSSQKREVLRQVIKVLGRRWNIIMSTKSARYGSTRRDTAGSASVLSLQTKYSAERRQEYVQRVRVYDISIP